MMPAAVVLGLSPTGLYAVRELGRAGIAVLGVAERQQAGCWSRYLTFGPRVIVDDDENERLRRLLAAAPPEAGRVPLIACSDQDIAFIQRHRSALSQRFVYQSSYDDGVAERLMDKAELYRLCGEIGIDVPGFWEVERAAVSSLAATVRFPCLVKPSLIHAVKAEMAGRKLWTARNRQELSDVADVLPRGATTWLVQEIVPGPESEITLFAGHVDGDGNIRQATTCRKLRQYPPGFGSASLVRTKLDAETLALSTRLLAAAGYRGIAATEFKRDPRDGRLKIIEMNARPSLWFAVTGAAGRHATLSAWHELMKREPLPEQPQVDGIEWRYGAKDAWSRAFYALNRDFVLPRPELDRLPPATRKVAAVYAADDPLPAVGELANFGGKIASRLRRRKRA